VQKQLMARKARNYDLLSGTAIKNGKACSWDLQSYQL